MFFFLSKTLNYLMMPLVIISILFVAAAVLKNKWKKRCFISGLVLLLFFSNEFIANELMAQWEIPATPYHSIEKKYSWGILLSGVAKAGMKPDDRVYFSRGADRVVHTVQLYKLGIIEKVLVSGGSGRLLDIGERESNDLADAMVLMGVAPKDIVIESDSRNTYESAVAVKKLLLNNAQSSDCILITSGYHMRRSLGCFNKQDWPMDSFSADFLSHPRSYTFDTMFIPKIEALLTWHHLIKETVGYLSYKVAGYI
ncbi:MAG: YdcF family protein [Cyclobacteriaceae bacterium]